VAVTQSRPQPKLKMRILGLRRRCVGPANKNSSFQMGLQATF